MTTYKKLSTEDIFRLDGKAYNVRIDDFTNDAEVLDGENTGRTQEEHGAMYREIVGRFINFTVTFSPNGMSYQEYDDLFYELSSPKKFHTITLPHPFKQGKLLTYKAYCTKASRQLKRAFYNANGLQCHKWGATTVKFVAMERYD